MNQKCSTISHYEFQNTKNREMLKASKDSKIGDLEKHKNQADTTFLIRNIGLNDN
jgi:hypothetical protein